MFLRIRFLRFSCLRFISFRFLGLMCLRLRFSKLGLWFHRITHKFKFRFYIFRISSSSSSSPTAAGERNEHFQENLQRCEQLIIFISSVFKINSRFNFQHFSQECVERRNSQEFARNQVSAAPFFGLFNISKKQFEISKFNIAITQKASRKQIVIFKYKITVQIVWSFSRLQVS